MRSRLELVDPHTARAAALWQELERAARPAYFLTWGWIENWLAMLPRTEAPSLAIIRDGSEVTGAFFLGRRLVIRHRVLPSRAAFLNATGIPSRDELCIEHNGVLGTARSLAELVRILPADWDELFLPGVDRDAYASLDVPRGYRVLVEGTTPAPYVDLARVRAAKDYLSLLSSNTRAQIRRARRHIGACTLEVARTLEEAFATYDEMVELHAASWQARGKPGAFADPWFARFHRRLIERRFQHGEIQLARLRGPAGTLGCLYNLVANGRVLFYQSGLSSFDDGAIKPGLLCHAATIEHCAAAGHAVYDMLAGSTRYKSSLSTDTQELAWLRVQRTRLRFAIEDRVRTWKHAVTEALA